MRNLKNALIIATLFAGAAYLRVHGHASAAEWFVAGGLIGWIFTD